MNQLEQISEHLNQQMDTAVLHPQQVTFLMDLNEYCFYEIFRWLSVNDVSSIAKTCKRIERVAGDHFQREYPTKSMVITSVFDKIQLSEKNQFFATNIRNVDIGRDAIYSYLTSNYNPNIKSIRFSLIDFETLDEQCLLHPRLNLQNVETVSFTGTIDFSILKYCHRMKHLSLSCIRHCKRSQSDPWLWLRMKYPKLEYFETVLSFSDEYQIDVFKKFLQQNPNIKRLTLGLVDNFLVKSIEDTINLDTLYLSISEQIKKENVAFPFQWRKH